MCKALAEFRICFAEGLLRVDLQKSREVYEDKQQIAEFTFQFRRGSMVARVCQLAKFFIKFFEHLIGIVPIKPVSGLLLTDWLRLHLPRPMSRILSTYQTLRAALHR